MSSGTQVKVALHKQANPELYCKHHKCLWRISGKYGKPCERHPIREEKTDAQV